MSLRPPRECHNRLCHPCLLAPSAPCLLLCSASVLAARWAQVWEPSRDLVAAHERQVAAREQYEARAAASEDLRGVANQRLIEFSALQRAAFTGVVQRMVAWLRSHAKQVRESDRLLVDGLEVSLSLMPSTVGREEAVAGWLTGASNTALAGLGTAGAVTTAVEKYGVAGTGARVSDLSGAAKQKAAAAFRGGGPLKNGGGDRLGQSGNQDRSRWDQRCGRLHLQDRRRQALTRAEEFATHIQVACAEFDVRTRSCARLFSASRSSRTC